MQSASPSEIDAFTPDKLLIAVMSYGMGELLRHCLASIQRNAPHIAVHVYDDGSADAATQQVLCEAERWCPVWRRDRSRDLPTDRKTGGLHANMNRALADAEREGFQYVGFIQDDIQLVRPLDDQFFEEYATIWSAHRSIAQIRWMFMKDPNIHPGHSSSHWYADRSQKFYWRTPCPQGLLDTGVCHLGRLKSTAFMFGDGEGLNAVKSVSAGLYSVFPKNPTCAWMPWPTTVSKRLSWPKRTLQFLTDRMFHVGEHPLQYMKPIEVESMVSRDASELPYAEQFLRLVNGSPRLQRPWWYEHSYAFIAQNAGRAFALLKRSHNVGAAN